MINDEKLILKKANIALVGHVTESYGPMQALPSFLQRNVDEFTVISHPFSYCGILSSECSFFVKGKLAEKYNLLRHKFKTFYFLHYFGDLLITFYFFFRLGKKWDIFIGCDCLNTFCGVLLKELKLVKKVIFYENEYKVRRFDNVILNLTFHFFNGFTARRSDVIWDSPPGMESLRESQSVLSERIIRVPHGVDLEKVKIPKEVVNRYELVYVGHVTDSKGLQLVTSVLGEVVKRVPQVKMTIVGSGPFEEKLRNLVEKNGLQDHYLFWGYTDHDWTLSYLPKCGVGLAPYTPLDKQALMYAEPLKVKDYLACGLPVIMTKFSQVAQDIEEREMGIAIEYHQKDLKEAILKLFTDKKFYNKCRKNVLSYDKNITWDETYFRSFRKTLKILKE